MRPYKGDYPALDIKSRPCLRWLRQAGALISLILVFFFVSGIVTFAEVSKFVVVGPKKSCVPSDAGGVFIFDASTNLNFSVNCEIPAQVIIKFNRHRNYDGFACYQFGTFGESALLNIGSPNVQCDIVPFKKRPRFSNVDNGVMYSDLRTVDQIQPYKPDAQFWPMSSVEFIAGDFYAVSSSFSGYLCIVKALADDLQLHIEKPYLNPPYENQAKRENSDGITPRQLPPWFLLLVLAFGAIGFFGALALCRMTGILR